MAAEQNLQRHHALNVQLADTLSKLVSPNLPNRNSVYTRKLLSEMQAAVPKGYEAVLRVLQPYMSDSAGYGSHITKAVDSALANPAVNELREAVAEAAGSLQSATPAPGGVASPAAQPAASAAKPRGYNPKVEQWQVAYNTRMGLKPNMPGYLKTDGLWGPRTQAAYQKMQQPAATPAAAPGQAMPPAPPPPPPDLSAYESIYPRLAEEFNDKIGPQKGRLGKHPGVERVLREYANRWAKNRYSPQLINWLIQKTVQNLSQEDLSKFNVS